jgi:hypothetical protein
MGLHHRPHRKTFFTALRFLWDFSGTGSSRPLLARRCRIFWVLSPQNSASPTQSVSQLSSSFPAIVPFSPPLCSLPLTSPPSIFSWSSPNPTIPSFPLSPTLEQSLFTPPLLGLGSPPHAQTTTDWPPSEQGTILAHPYPFEEQCYFQDHTLTTDEGFISANL